MKQLFLAISAAIEAVPGIKWVDFDLGQFENEENQGVSHPAALIRFDSASYSNLAGEEQQGDISVTIRLGFDSYGRTHSKTDAAKRATALEHLDTVQLVHLAVQGLNSSESGPMSRTGFATEPRADLRIYALTYSTLINDSDLVPGASTDFQPWRELLTDGDLEFCHDTKIE